VPHARFHSVDRATLFCLKSVPSVAAAPPGVLPPREAARPHNLKSNCRAEGVEHALCGEPALRELRVLTDPVKQTRA